MTEPNKEKITASQTIEEIEQLKAKYEADKEIIQQKNLQLENIIAKKNDEIFELQKDKERTMEERDDWKKEAHRNRRTQQQETKTKQETDFLSELAKLQAKKGLNINE